MVIEERLNSLRRWILVASIILAITCSLDAIAQDKHPMNGTWKANLEKSRRHPNHLFQSLTMTIDVTTDVVIIMFSGVNMSGKEETGTTKLVPDGKDYAIPQAPGVVQVTRWVNPNTLETSGKKDGAVVGQSTYEVSTDKKTLTVRIHGVDANGLPFEQMIVLDRQ